MAVSATHGDDVRSGVCVEYCRSIVIVGVWLLQKEEMFRSMTTCHALKWLWSHHLGDGMGQDSSWYAEPGRDKDMLCEGNGSAGRKPRGTPWSSAGLAPQTSRTTQKGNRGNLRAVTLRQKATKVLSNTFQCRKQCDALCGEVCTQMRMTFRSCFCTGHHAAL